MAKHPEVGEVVPIMVCMGIRRLRPKGYFWVSLVYGRLGISIVEVYERVGICHFGLYYDLKGLQKDFCGCEKVGCRI